MPASEGRGLFITGTDTGVGKTLVAAALALHLRRLGYSVGVVKPVETGVDDPSQLGPDGTLLRWAAGGVQDPEHISPYRLTTPAAPTVAASKEQVRIDYTGLLETAHEVMQEHDLTLIEGAGGLMVPLAGGHLMADFAKALKVPLLVVCRAGLGTINHSLLTLYAARCMDLNVAGYFINNMPEEKTIAEESAPHSLASLASDDLLGVLPRVSGSDREMAQQLETRFATLPTYRLLSPWLTGNKT